MLVETTICRSTLLGDLQSCIDDRNIIRIKLRKSCNDLKGIRFCPVAVEYLSTEFYLLGYLEGELDKLFVFTLEEIEFFQITSQTYEQNIGERYSYTDGRCLLQNIQKKKGR